MATRHHTKKHHSKKASHSKKTSHTKKASTTKMSNNNVVAHPPMAMCPGCDKKMVKVHDVKIVRKTMKNGRTMRRMAALCPMNHKVSRILGFD